LTPNTYRTPALLRKVLARWPGGAELMNVLPDRPELDAVAGHQTHGLLNRCQVSQRREFIEKIEDG